MIQKTEILTIAKETSLLPSVIEKDYVLGWILAGIFAYNDLRESWIFKGGTCLKKCYFNTYRFSEDLDFTLRNPGHINKDFLQKAFTKITAWIYEKSGIEFPNNPLNFDLFPNPRGNLICQGKIFYRGPVSPQKSLKNLPRIKLDLTADEYVVLPPIRVSVFHPYSDMKEAAFDIQAYAYEEVFGEKVRALAERTRPRDLYDVIYLFRNKNTRPLSSALYNVIKKKCAFKEISMPNFEDIISQRSQLQAGWENMLKHQLPTLPNLDSFLDELPAFFRWLYQNETPQILQVLPSINGTISLSNQAFKLKLLKHGHAILENIRFAAANRLCIDLEYMDKGNRSIRRIEPYSIRRSKSGEIFLAAVRSSNEETRMYNLDRIIQAIITNQTFKARYEIELVPGSLIPLKSISRK